MITVGEIKAEAMRLMNIEFNGADVSVLEFDENCKDLYNRLTGALNRGLADFETKRALPLKRVLLSSPRFIVRGVAVFYLTDAADLLMPVRLTKIGEDEVSSNHPFFFEAGGLTVYNYEESAVYELYYHGTAVRVTDDTPNNTVLDLPRALADALPYYIKADVYRVDEPGEANDARNWYETLVAQYIETVAAAACVQSVVDTVYGGYCDEEV